MAWWHTLEVQLTFFLDAAVTLITIPWILMTKKESTSAVAWCLLVFFVPFLGSLLFVLFGYQHVHRPLKRKRRHKTHFRMAHAGSPWQATPGPDANAEPD